jgi:hypothetical protein
MKRETRPVSETVYSVVSKIPNDGQSPKKKEILSAFRVAVVFIVVATHTRT